MAPFPTAYRKRGDFCVEWIPANRYYPSPSLVLLLPAKYRIPHGRGGFFHPDGFVRLPLHLFFRFNGKWITNCAIRQAPCWNCVTYAIRYSRIMDQRSTFGVNRKHSTEFLNRLSRNLRFHWITLALVDVMAENSCPHVAAGCHTNHFGVASRPGNPPIPLKRGTTTTGKRIFALCRKRPSAPWRILFRPPEERTDRSANDRIRQGTQSRFCFFQYSRPP
jgi:hypothetical protein